MGVKHFYQVFEKAGQIINPKDEFKGAKLIIDGNRKICSTIKCLKNPLAMTDKKGVPTIALSVIVDNFVSYKKYGVSSVIYVLDNPKPNTNKIAENKKRSDNAKKRIAKLENEEKGKTGKELKECKDKTANARARITPEMFTDVKKLFSLLGISYITAPENFEAEHLAAELTIQGYGTHVDTTDSDALVFGAKAIIMTKTIKRKKVMMKYSLEKLYKEYDLNREQLINISISLGTDFAPNTKKTKETPNARSIGKGRALTQKDVEPGTKLQQKAKQIFFSKPPFTGADLHTSQFNKNDAIEWLVAEKNFNRTRLEKKFSKIK